MYIICSLIGIEIEALYSLINKVVARIKEKENEEEDKWWLPEKTMKKLGIKSDTTMQKYRNEGMIRFNQPSKKVILMIEIQFMSYLKKR